MLLRAICIGLPVCAIIACGGGGYGGNSNTYNPPPSAAPTVTLAAVNATANRTVALSATPTAANGVTRVDFLVDSVVIGMSTTAPYTTNWDTSTVADGAHTVAARVTDAMNLAATSASTNVTVANNVTIPLALTPNEEYPKPASTASGAGQLDVNLATGAISGQFTLSGLTATAAHIHDGYAGNNGAIVVGFVANGSVAGRWDLPAASVLTGAQVDKLLAGELYVNAHSAAYPAGELRAQIKPGNITVVFADMNGSQEVPAVTTAASGFAAVTVDAAANAVSVHIKASGVDDATGANIRKGAAGATGAVVVALNQDAVNAGHWSAERQNITATQLADFNNNGWYANIETPANPSGEIRGQIAVTTTAATTLTQLQTNIFTPRCSGCHTGGGATLPGAMNLTSAANSYAALVGVASIEQGTVLRVKANDSANSYLVQKLEGTATITGSRMPLGGPFLDQATIDQVKSWIDAGAPNN